MKGFFDARSVAVVGASPRPGNLGRNIVDNMRGFGYSGQIFMVSPSGGEYQGRPVYQTPADLPETPELGVVITPATFVPAMLDQLGERGVKRVIIESGGFGELGERGEALSGEIKAIAQKWDMRFIGPNCIGVVSLPLGLCTPFPALDAAPPAGPVSILAQSGGMALTWLARLAEQGIGLSRFVSLGNKLNVDECDLLEFLTEDPATEVIVLYLESIASGRRLYETIRKCGKPVVVQKSNIAAASAGIAASHTAALANDDLVVSAALEQAGAARMPDFASALETVKALVIPRPKGRRMAVISRSGGHAVAAADAVHRNKMELAELPESFFEPIRQASRARVINLQNPLDLGDLFDFGLYVKIVENALALPSVDSVLLVTAYRGEEAEGGRRLMGESARLMRKYGKPVALCPLCASAERARAVELAQGPIFEYPDQAVAAFAAAAKLCVERPDALTGCGRELDQERIARILSCAMPNGELELPEALTLVDALGIPVAPFATVASPEEAAEAARRLIPPVALKAVGESLSHKTESGGVVLGLKTKAKVEQAARELFERLGCRRLVVMRMITGGRESILGVKQDASFGPCVLFGAGGTTAEILGDVSLKLAPVGGDEAGAMIDSLASAPLFHGYRGAPPVHRAALVSAIVKMSLLAAMFPQVAEMDINPLLTGPGGVAAVDARVRLSGPLAR